MITEWFCFQHNDGDIKIRHHGMYRCSAWTGPDGDPCHIVLAQIREHGTVDLNDMPEPNRTVR